MSRHLPRLFTSLTVSQLVFVRLVAMALHDRLIYRLCNKVRESAQAIMTASNAYVSVKWVGLFVTALVGLYTIEDLWEKFGDLKMSAVSTPPL